MVCHIGHKRLQEWECLSRDLRSHERTRGRERNSSFREHQWWNDDVQTHSISTRQWRVSQTSGERSLRRRISECGQNLCCSVMARAQISTSLSLNTKYKGEDWWEDWDDSGRHWSEATKKGKSHTQHDVPAPRDPYAYLRGDKYPPSLLLFEGRQHA